MAKPTKRQLAAEALARSLAHAAAAPTPFWYVMTDSVGLHVLGSHIAGRQMVQRQQVEEKGYPIFASESEAKAYRDPIYTRQCAEYRAANPNAEAQALAIAAMPGNRSAGHTAPGLSVADAVAEAAERDSTTPEPLRSKQVAGKSWRDDEDADHAIFGTH